MNTSIQVTFNKYETGVVKAALETYLQKINDIEIILPDEALYYVDHTNHPYKQLKEDIAKLITRIDSVLELPVN